jgi:polyisoprenoid-binding protein YceI
MNRLSVSLSRATLALVFAATAIGAHAAPLEAVTDASSKVTFTAYTKLFDAEGSLGGVKTSGTIDAENLAASRPTVTVDTRTIDTGSGARDKHLRTEDFFFVEKYPTATFVVTKIEPKEGDQFLVSGDMTIRDVTKKITVPSTITRGTLKSGEKTVRVQAKFPVKWKEYGMPWSGAFYAPEIKEVIDVKVDLVFLDKSAPAPTP